MQNKFLESYTGPLVLENEKFTHSLKCIISSSLNNSGALFCALSFYSFLVVFRGFRPLNLFKSSQKLTKLSFFCQKKSS